ncbi:MAG: hypothetical protein EON95_16000 [Caulobacteraceae bacterium]|nr:hypothetical protein [Caulobacter sp.]RYF90925.1 MAG: hypothetical protein EON95_16000 [Caulobacteraceae bacterium]
MTDEALGLLAGLPIGYSEGDCDGARWGVTVKRSDDGRRWWLWGEALAGGGHVSGNLYVLEGGRALLKPCEMPAETVLAFLRTFRPDRPPVP